MNRGACCVHDSNCDQSRAEGPMICSGPESIPGLSWRGNHHSKCYLAIERWWNCTSHPLSASHNDTLYRAWPRHADISQPDRTPYRHMVNSRCCDTHANCDQSDPTHGRMECNPNNKRCGWSKHRNWDCTDLSSFPEWWFTTTMQGKAARHRCCIDDSSCAEYDG